MKTKKNQLVFYSIVVISCLILAQGCSKEEKNLSGSNKKTETKNADSNSSGNNKEGSSGKQLFYMKSTQNNIACADCHSDGINSANILTKYFSNIQGADKRTSTFLGKFKGEDVSKNAGGATLCWEVYMKMKTPLTDEQIKSLNEYYGSVKGNDSPAEIKYETLALPEKNKAKLKEEQKIIMGLKGDPVKGEKDFNNSCGFCHGDKSTVKKVPSLFEDFDGNIKSITYNIRFGNGAMPFFKKDNLSDQEIADISAYILSKNAK
jgi:cytochrome c553